jgi:hypothetical protein
MAEGEIAQPPPTNADGGNDANHAARTMKANNTLEVDEVVNGPTIGANGKKAPLRPAPTTSQRKNSLDGQKTSRAVSMTLHYRKAVSHTRKRLKKSQDMPVRNTPPLDPTSGPRYSL